MLSERYILTDFQTAVETCFISASIRKQFVWYLQSSCGDFLRCESLFSLLFQANGMKGFVLLKKKVINSPKAFFWKKAYNFMPKARSVKSYSGGKCLPRDFVSLGLIWSIVQSRFGIPWSEAFLQICLRFSNWRACAAMRRILLLPPCKAGARCYAAHMLKPLEMRQHLCWT